MVSFKTKKLFTNSFYDSDSKDNVVVECVDVCKDIKTVSYKTEILKNINLKINAGEITIILGPSGSGKTTLLNIIAGIEQVTSGQVYLNKVLINNLNDNSLTKLRRDKIAYIYQRYGLIPIATVFDNIKLGENLVKKNQQKIDFNMVVEKTGLKELLTKFPHELSGGQKQRVAIARSLMKQPELMLCDEPTGALDDESSNKIIELFKMINNDFKTTIVMVTHNNELIKIANKVIYIKDGQIEKIDINK